MEKIENNVSVVIPVYNREDTIQYALESVLNQTVQPKEILVVDDCSNDRTREKVMYMSEKFPIIKYFCLECNSGAQKARNKGIYEAKSKWIAFLDSDDKWISTKLEMQLEVLSKLHFDVMTVIYTDCYIDTKGEYTLWKLEDIDGIDTYSSILLHPGPMFQGIITSKEALVKIGYLDEQVPSYQEWDTSIQLGKHCRFIHLKEPLFIYCKHDGDTISKNLKNDIDGYHYIINKYEKEIINKHGYKYWNQHIYNQIIRCIKFSLWSLEKKQLIYVKNNSFIDDVILSIIIALRGKGRMLMEIYKVIKIEGVGGLLNKLKRRIRE